ncbi:MAG TPA: patatin-like phospholipase family protein [Bacillota bacterium]
MHRDDHGVTLILGGGFARGLAHVGVVQQLVTAGVPIRRLVGISAGALVASVYTLCGLEGMLAHAARFLAQARRVVRPARLNRRSLLCPWRLARYLHGIFGGAQIEDLPGRVSIVATDLESAEPVLLERGPLVPALLASTSVPGLYPPLRWGGRWLCDGALSAHRLLAGPLIDEPGPVVFVVLRRRAEVRAVRRLNRLARRLLSDRPLAGPWTPTWWRVWRRSAELVEPLTPGPARRGTARRPVSAPRPDVLVLRPAVDDIPWNGFDQGRRAVAAGRRAAVEALPALLGTLGQPVMKGTAGTRT